jgi:N-carbamoylputrescine amidase
MSQLNVGLIQHSCTADTAANLSKTMAGIREAAAKGAQLVVLQELHRWLYFCEQESVDEFDLAEPIPGPTTRRVAARIRSRVSSPTR